MKLFTLLVLFLLLWGSVLERVKKKRNRYRVEGTPFPVEPTSSLLSQSIVEILAVAGGIYLSLIMVVAFLQVDVSPKVVLGTLRVDSLAFFSLLLALLQPFLSRVFSLKDGR